MSVSVPAEVVSLNSTVFFSSIFSTWEIPTPIDFLAKIVTPLSLEKFPWILYLLKSLFWFFFHFLTPFSSSLLSTMMWMSALMLVIAWILRSDFLPFGQRDLILVHASKNSLNVFCLLDLLILYLFVLFVLRGQFHKYCYLLEALLVDKKDRIFHCSLYNLFLFLPSSAQDPAKLG